MVGVNMKRLIAITLGIGMLATAGATAISTPTNARKGLTMQIDVTTEQSKALQARYRYWSSSQTVTLKTPI